MKLGAAGLTDILAAMDDADDTAANWLRLAVDAVAEGEIAAGRNLPADALESHVKDAKRGGASRRLAYEWLVKADPAAPERIIPGLLDDPAPEMRRDAVALAIKDAEAVLAKGDKPAAAAAFARVLHHARDTDQVRAVIGKLGGLGLRIDNAAQFGLLRKWMLLGPFDGPGSSGYNLTFAPEEKIDPGFAAPGKNATPLKWTEFSSADADAVVDLNKARQAQGRGRLRAGVRGIARRVRGGDPPGHAQRRKGLPQRRAGVRVRGVSPRQRPHRPVRLQSDAEGRPQRHLGEGVPERADRRLAQDWKFQLRVCDSLGAPVPLTPHVEKKQIAVPSRLRLSATADRSAFALSRKRLNSLTPDPRPIWTDP